MLPISNDYSIALLRLSLLLLIGLAPPSEFWTVVSGAFAVPDDVKVLVAPLMGSAAATAVEYLIHLSKRTPAPASPVYWPLKVFVGWVSGAYGGTAMEAMIKATPQMIAFWAGVGGYGAIALYLATQNKNIREKDNETL